MADGTGPPPGDNGQVNGTSMLHPRPWPAPGLAGRLAEQLEQLRSVLRRTVAFIGSAEPRTRPTARVIGVDIALAAIATVALLATMGKTSTFPLANVRFGPAHTVQVIGVPNLLGWQRALLAIFGTAPLAFRRLWPLTAFWPILGTAVATPGYRETVVTLIVVIVAAYSAVAYSRFRGAAMLGVLAAGLLATAALHGTLPQLPDGTTALWLLIPILVVGNAMHIWRRKAGDSQARLARLQAEHEAATRQALELERARIAGELHDVVTHNVSVMIVQAGAARQVLAAAPDQARSAMLAVEASGRAAMTELRHLLGLLGPPGAADNGLPAGDLPAGGLPSDGLPGDGLPAGGARASQDLRPQPGLRQLRPLVDRVAAAGLPVQLHVGDVPPGIPPGPDLAAFRVVQEALTNVIKHAGKPRTSVSVDYRDGDLFVAVADAGRPTVAVGPTLPGTGRGLLGLRERMALYGGELAAGPGPDGGWLVRARIPVDPLPTALPVS
jgi:signal transduction histidine kinase